MPLPNIKKRCVVTARSTGEQCKNPAAFGCKSCRYHGARRQCTVRSGADHTQYKHGKFTQEAKKKYQEACAELRTLEELAYELGMMEGPRRKGRKVRSR